MHETRFNLPEYIIKRCQYFDSPWSKEILHNRQKIALVGPQAFTEKCLDNYMMNWFIASAEVFFPNMKEIFIDKKDDELFRAIDKSKGKKIVVVVN